MNDLKSPFNKGRFTRTLMHDMSFLSSCKKGRIQFLALMPKKGSKNYLDVNNTRYLCFKFGNLNFFMFTRVLSNLLSLGVVFYSDSKKEAKKYLDVK